MADFFDWGEKFGKDWWSDVTTGPVYTDIRNC